MTAGRPRITLALPFIGKVGEAASGNYGNLKSPSWRILAPGLP
jgi:hypothetical protein